MSMPQAYLSSPDFFGVTSTVTGLSSGSGASMPASLITIYLAQVLSVVRVTTSRSFSPWVALILAGT